jgi:hypothetical protein
MADDIAITAGSGTPVATDEIGGRHFQRIKPAWGTDGTAVDVSASSPLPVVAYGELVEAVQALRTIAHSLDMSIGRSYANAAGRLLVEASIAASQTLGTITTVSTVTTLTTCSTLTNQTQIGGINAAPQIPALMQLGAASLRSNITTS